MIKKPFFALETPRLEYDSLKGRTLSPAVVPTPRKVTLLLPNRTREDRLFLKVKPGDGVKTGQKISFAGENTAYAVSSVTGTVSDVSLFSGDFGRLFTAVSIEVSQEEQLDEAFGAIAPEPTLDGIRDFLVPAPGAPPLHTLSDPQKPVTTIVVMAADADLLVTTRQYALRAEKNAVRRGVEILKTVSGAEKIMLVVPPGLMQDAVGTGAAIQMVQGPYPAALPHSIMKDVLGQIVPEGKSFEDLGVSFFSAEAVASIGKAFEEARVPVHKIFTLVKKDGSRTLVSARIGTPIQDVFKATGVIVKEGDRIVIGGPMTGSAVFSESYPILPDTDALIVQDGSRVQPISDYPCINCGQCIRACPARMPVNMLVRYLAFGRYEDGADQYDLYCCIGCGLCSYVCPSQIPIFQYIRLAKYELGRIRKTEEANV